MSNHTILFIIFSILGIFLIREGSTWFIFMTLIFMLSIIAEYLEDILKQLKK